MPVLLPCLFFSSPVKVVITFYIIILEATFTLQVNGFGSFNNWNKLRQLVIRVTFCCFGGQHVRCSLLGIELTGNLQILVAAIKTAMIVILKKSLPTTHFKHSAHY